MIGFNSPAEIELDASRFSDDEETRVVAEVVAKYAEKRRQEYRASEQPIKRGLLAIEGYWSDSVPWYEWMTEPQILQPCAEECQLPIYELANVIAYQMRPINWQVFSWMGAALEGREYGEILSNSLSKYATTLAAIRDKKQVDARSAANALHNKPGGSRDKQDAIRSAWKSGKYSSRDVCAEQECAHIGMSFSAARKALRNVPLGT
jgi:hypothetical protein